MTRFSCSVLQQPRLWLRVGLPTCSGVNLAQLHRAVRKLDKESVQTQPGEHREHWKKMVVIRVAPMLAVSHVPCRESCWRASAVEQEPPPSQMQCALPTQARLHQVWEREHPKHPRLPQAQGSSRRATCRQSPRSTRTSSCARRLQRCMVSQSTSG